MLGRRVMERRVKTGTKRKERTRIKIVKVSVYVCEVGGGGGGGVGGGRGEGVDVGEKSHRTPCVICHRSVIFSGTPVLRKTVFQGSKFSHIQYRTCYTLHVDALLCVYFFTLDARLCTCCSLRVQLKQRNQSLFKSDLKVNQYEP